MQMMYDIIYKALVEAGLENEYEPQDYLNFFCLGNREAKDVEATPDAGNHPLNSPQVNLLQLDNIYRNTCVSPHILLICYYISWCLLFKLSPLLNVLDHNTVLFAGTCTKKSTLYDLCPFKRNDSG